MVGKQSTERIWFIRQGRLEPVFLEIIWWMQVYRIFRLSDLAAKCVGRKSTESHPPPALQNIEQVCNKMSRWMESVSVQFEGLNLPRGKFWACCKKSNSLSWEWSRFGFATLGIIGVVWTCECHSLFSPISSLIHPISTSDLMKWHTFSWAAIVS